MALGGRVATVIEEPPRWMISPTLLQCAGRPADFANRVLLSHGQAEGSGS
jgi:hypothetical protein